MELIGYAAGVWFCACVLAGVLSPLLRAVRWLASVLREVAEERPAPVLLLVLALAFVFPGCEDDSPRKAASPASEAARDDDSQDPRYDFLGIASALSDDDTDLTPLTPQQLDSVTFSEAQMLRKLARILIEHPDHFVVGIHLGKINVDSSRHQVKDRISYVIEVTGGEPDGNCFDFYDARTGKFYLGSCFHTDRGNPNVRPFWLSGPLRETGDAAAGSAGG